MISHQSVTISMNNVLFYRESRPDWKRDGDEGCGGTWRWLSLPDVIVYIDITQNAHGPLFYTVASVFNPAGSTSSSISVSIRLFAILVLVLDTDLVAPFHARSTNPLNHL